MSHLPHSAPVVRLSAQGYLRLAVMRALCVPMLAGGLYPVISHAAPVGSAAWFAQIKAAQPSASSTTRPAVGSSQTPILGNVSTPQQAQANTQRSMASLTKAMSAILQAQAAQRAARLSGASQIVNDLGAGGLQANTNNPVNCVSAYNCLWQNAELPTQITAKDALTGADTYTVTVKQTAKKAILNWDSFNIGTQTTLNFDQSQGTQKDGLNDWVALNRVNANASPSQIFGKIKADGSVYLINPNGVIFGAGSQVNVHSLIASSLPIYLSDSAKSLKPNDNADYISASNRLFLETGINSVGTGTANGRLLGLGSGQTITAADNSDAQGQLTLPSKIDIQAGASISSNKLGYVLLAAPELHNAGTVSAVDGQVILASGLGVSLKGSADGSLLLNPILSGSLTAVIDGVVKDVTPAVTANNQPLLVNQGLVQGIRSDVRLLAASIKQDGIVAATTSVSQAGNITLSAQDKQATDTALGRTGSLVLTGKSVTTILPDANGETTISTPAASQNFKAGTINLTGGAVTLEKNALVVAPSQKVSITAIAQNDANIAADGIKDGSIAGRVYIDSGAVVDVAGIADVKLSAESTLITIPRLGLNELADSPLQKDSLLYGAAVIINSSITGVRDDGVSWIGTPLANLSGYVQQVKRNIDQLLQHGGTINLAGNEVLTQTGSLLNLDGGYIHYLGASLQTTRLLAANGRLVDIAKADPNERYVGIAGRFQDNHERWNNSLVYINPLLSGARNQGVYESDYIHGGNAGTLNLYGLTTTLLSGDVSAAALSGRYQVAGSHLSKGGSIYLGAGTNEAFVKAVLPNPTIPDLRALPSYVVVKKAPSLNDISANFTATSTISDNGLAITDTTNLLHWTPVEAEKLQQAGFSTVSIIADDAAATKPTQGGEVVVQENANLTVKAGGTIKLSGSRVQVDGKLTASSGTINLIGTGRTYVAGSTVLPDNQQNVKAGDVTIGSHAVLDARGQWVNDTGRDSDHLIGGAYINGGSVSISTQQNATAITKVTTQIKTIDNSTGLSSETSSTTYNPFTPAVPSTTSETTTTGNSTVIKTIITEVSTPDLTGSINLAANSVIDVSSGGRVLPTGLVAQKNYVPLGKGGNISLHSYVPSLLAFGGNGNGVPQLPSDVPPANGKLNLQGLLRGYGFSGGGTLSLRTLGLQIGGSQPVDAPWVMVLPENYFDKTGFGHIYLQAEYNATISALTTLNLSQYNFISNDFVQLAQMANGTNVATEAAKNDYLTIGQLDESRRQPVNFTLFSGDYATWSPTPDYSDDGITGTLLVDKGAVIQGDAGAAITLGSMTQVTVEGTVRAHGGSITLTGDTAKGGYAQVAGLIVNGNAPISDHKSVWLGSDSVLDVSGTTLLDPLATLVNKPIRSGRVLDGGTVTLTNDTGYVVVQDCRDSGACAADTEASKVRAATINVSGTSATLDLANAANSTSAKVIASDAGTVRIGAAKGLFFHGKLQAQAGGNNNEGGTLAITPLRGSFVAAEEFAGATAISLTKTIIPMPKGPEGEIIKAGDIDVLLEADGATGVLHFATDSLVNSGITSLHLGVDPTLNAAQPALPINFYRDVIKTVNDEQVTEVFSESINLKLDRELIINASMLRGPKTTAKLGTTVDAEDIIHLTGKVDYVTPEINIVLEAPYVNISGLQQGGNYPLFYGTDELDNPVPTDIDGNVLMPVSFAKDTTVIVDKLKEDDDEGTITTTVNVLAPTTDSFSFDDALGLNYTVDSRTRDEDGLTLSRDDEFFTDLLPQFYKSKLTINAEAIDMGGQLMVDGFASLSLNSKGDLRFITPSSYNYLRDPSNLAQVSSTPGLLQTTAEVNLSAGQIYPATGNKFVINALGRYLNSISKVIDDPTDPESTVTYTQLNQLTGNHINVRTTGSRKSATPLSAGGSLIFNAANISQGGVVRAPDGQIILGASSATDAYALAQLSYKATSPLDLITPLQIQIPVIATEKVELLAGSETSVSLGGLIVPYGTTADSQNLQYNGSATSAAGAATAVPTLTSAPLKQVAINGATIQLDKGASINVSGGGDLQAQEWIAGTGGSRNILNAYNVSYASGSAQSVPLYADGRAVYAVIPGYNSQLAAYDPQLVADPLIGKAVYLSGTKGLPAGVYTLLPGRYATLPNAFRVVQDTSAGAIDALASLNSVMPDGTARVAGYYTDLFSGARDARTTSFLVQSNKVWQQYSQFELTSLNSYFANANNALAALPKDAGQLILNAKDNLTLGAKIQGQTVAGGLGADINITAPKLHIADSSVPALAGYVNLSSQDLNALGASRLVLGGVSRATSAFDLLTATATDVVINTPKVGIRAPEILVMARSYLPVALSDDAPEPELQVGSVTIKANSILQASGGQQRVRTQPIQVGLLPDVDDNGNDIDGATGDGALLRLSSGKAVTISRINVSGIDGDSNGDTPTGVLRIDNNVQLLADGAVTLDTVGNMVVAPTVTIKANSFDANSSDISFSNTVSAIDVPNGLVAGPQLLAQLANIDHVALRSRGTIKFLGDLDLQVGKDLTLSGGNILSDGGTVTIHAQRLVLANELETAAGTVQQGSGLLNLQVDELGFGFGDVVLNGFNNVNVLARHGIVGEGTGSLTVGNADLNLHAPIFSANTATNTTLSSTGNITLDSVGVAQANNYSGIGGKITLTGKGLAVNSQVSAGAGKVILNAGSAGLTLGNQANINVSGQSKAFFDVQRYAAGGDIVLNSTGALTVDRAAVLNFAAAEHGGDAGSLAISAGDTLSLLGKLQGGAKAGQHGGDFSLLSAQAVDLDALVATLTDAKATGKIAISSQQGNLQLSSTKTLNAEHISLHANSGTGSSDTNNGNVIIDGTLNASGKKGGEIKLTGNSSVVVNGSLLAIASDSQQRGGNIVLATQGQSNGTVNSTYGYQNIHVANSGKISLGQSAVLDVHGGSAGGLANGTVRLRAPLLVDGGLQVNVANGSHIIGAREVAVEAVATWNTADNSTGSQHFDGIIDPLGLYGSDSKKLTTGINSDHRNFYGQTLSSFIRQLDSSLTTPLTGIDNLTLRAGIELVNNSPSINNGDINLVSHWNLAALSSDGSALYRSQQGIAPVLTVNAINNVNANASLSDGFVQTGNPFGFNSNLLPTTNSVSPTGTELLVSSLVDGDSSSFNLQAQTGSIRFNKVLQNTEVLWLYQAPLERPRNDSDIVSYSAQLSNGQPLPAWLSFDSETRTLSGIKDFATGGLAIKVIATHSAAAEDDAPVVTTATLKALAAPTMVRTGTGSISLQAGQDIAILDDLAPAVIYTAGRPTQANSTTVAQLVPSKDGLPLFINTGTVNPEAAGDIYLKAGRDVIGIQKVLDSSAKLTGNKNTDLSQFWWPWMQNPCLVTVEGCQAQTGSSINFGMFGQGILSVGGNVVVEAGQDIKDLSVSLPTTWKLSTDGQSQEQLAVYGGGDLAISAGGNLFSGSYFVAKGEGNIRVDGSIIHSIKFLTEAPFIDSLTPTLLAVQDGQLTVVAGSYLEVGAIYNPSWLFKGFDSQAYSSRSAVNLQSLTSSIVLGNGGVSAGGNYGVNPNSDDDGSILASAYSFVLPAHVTMEALSGAITIKNNAELYPATDGQLNLFANNDITLTNPDVNNSYIGLIDAPTTVLPSVQNQILVGRELKTSFIDGLNANFDLHSPIALHLTDNEPLRIYSAQGSLINGSENRQYNGAMIVAADKLADIRAGLDIVNLSFMGQNLYASDITNIQAGRDLYNTPLVSNQSVPFIELGGIGTLNVQAGRHLGPLTSANEALAQGYLPKGSTAYPGIRTVGSLNNNYLLREGANISLSFGVAPNQNANAPITQMAVDAFAQAYINPAVIHAPETAADKLGTPNFNQQLVAFVAQYQQDQQTRQGLSTTTELQQATRIWSTLSVAEQGKYAATAWTAFNSLASPQKQALVSKVFLDILNKVGTDFNDKNSIYKGQYSRGYQAINTLFPAVLGYTANSIGGGQNGADVLQQTGVFDMRGSTVQTQKGGDISILGPGGRVLVGSTSAPPQVAKSESSAGIGPNNQGILTLESGKIGLFSDNSILLAQSRIFTEQGGDVLIWSSNGDVNAGKGAKTSTEVPPPEYLCDPDHFCLVDAKSQVSGAGIAVLQTKVGAPSGSANLIAPRGTVDAGEAGIRVAGSLNIAAFNVANADNIQVQGEATGVPSAGVDSSAMSAANSASSAATQSATAAANGRQQKREVLASDFLFEYIGGDDDCNNDKDCKSTKL